MINNFLKYFGYNGKMHRKVLELKVAECRAKNGLRKENIWHICKKQNP